MRCEQHADREPIMELAGLAHRVCGSLTQGKLPFTQEPKCIVLSFWNTLHALRNHLQASDILHDAVIVAKGAVQGKWSEKRQSYHDIRYRSTLSPLSLDLMPYRRMVSPAGMHITIKAVCGSRSLMYRSSMLRVGRLCLRESAQKEHAVAKADCSAYPIQFQQTK